MTVRYYENIKLMPPPPRTQGGHRAYDATHVRWLTFIRRSRGLGFSIDEIRALLALAAPEHGSCAEVQAKVADLAKLEAILAQTILQCTGEAAAACPVLDMLDAR